MSENKTVPVKIVGIILQALSRQLDQLIHGLEGRLPHSMFKTTEKNGKTIQYSPFLSPFNTFSRWVRQSANLLIGDEQVTEKDIASIEQLLSTIKEKSNIE